MSFLNNIFLTYVGRQFFIRFFGLLLVFVVLLQMLDLLNSSAEVLAAPGAGWPSIIKYISLRAPQLASQFTPFAALLAVVITLTVLNHTSQITIMRAAGMSVNRVLFPISFVCFMITAGHFILHETVVVKATQKFVYWEANDFAVDLPPDDGTRTDLRISFDGELIRAGSAARIGETVRLNAVTINKLDQDGLVARIIEARSALYQNGGWRLFDVSDHNAQTLSTVTLAAAPWATQLQPGLVFALSLNPDRTSLPALATQIERLDAEGADTRAATTSFLARFSKPLSTLVMPLLGALAGFGVHRQGNQLARAVVGAALGFGYFVFENMLLALGKLGVMPAMLGAFFPFALFMVVGFAILLAMEN